MKKLSIKDIVDFRAKSDKSKKTFVTNLKLDKKEVKTDGGGDYWVSCLSSISNGFKSDNLHFITDKIDELEGKLDETDYKRTKTMYRRNIDILHAYEDFDFKNWRPSKKVTFLKKHKDDFTLEIKGLEVQVTPHHVFTFQRGEQTEIGAIWLIAKLNGFKKEELGMFTDILNLYLKSHYSTDKVTSSKYCIAVDVFNSIDVTFSELESGAVSRILNPTLEEIKKLM